MRKKPRNTLLLARKPLREITHCVWMHLSRRLKQACAGIRTPVNRFLLLPEWPPMQPPSLGPPNFTSRLLRAKRRKKRRKNNIAVAVVLFHRKMLNRPREADSHLKRNRRGSFGGIIGINRWALVPPCETNFPRSWSADSNNPGSSFPEPLFARFAQPLNVS